MFACAPLGCSCSFSISAGVFFYISRCFFIHLQVFLQSAGVLFGLRHYFIPAGVFFTSIGSFFYICRCFFISAGVFVYIYWCYFSLQVFFFLYLQVFLDISTGVPLICRVFLYLFAGVFLYVQKCFLNCICFFPAGVFCVSAIDFHVCRQFCCLQVFLQSESVPFVYRWCFYDCWYLLSAGIYLIHRSFYVCKCSFSLQVLLCLQVFITPEGDFYSLHVLLLFAGVSSMCLFGLCCVLLISGGSQVCRCFISLHVLYSSGVFLF